MWTVNGVVSVMDWNGSMVQCYNVTRTFQNVTAVGNNASRASTYYRTTDGAAIVNDYYELINTTGYYEEMYGYEYFNVPLEQGFPYSVGETWNQTFTANTTGYLNFWAPTPMLGFPAGWTNRTYVRGVNPMTSPSLWLNYTVVNETTVTVPAGTFDTWCVNVTGASVGPMTGLLYYSPAVKATVLAADPITGAHELELLYTSVSYPTQQMLLLILIVFIILWLYSSQSGLSL